MDDVFRITRSDIWSIRFVLILDLGRTWRSRATLSLGSSSDPWRRRARTGQARSTSLQGLSCAGSDRLSNADSSPSLPWTTPTTLQPPPAQVWARAGERTLKARAVLTKMARSRLIRTMGHSVLSLDDARRAARRPEQYLLWVKAAYARQFREPGWVKLEPPRNGAVLFVHRGREARLTRARQA